jgi:PAS domain S-box-containing protein
VSAAAPNVRDTPSIGAVVVPVPAPEARADDDAVVRYLDVSDELEEVVFQTDPEGRWTYLNRAWTAMTGYTPEETLGRHFLEFVHPEERAATVAMFQRVVGGGASFCHHETRYRTAAGGYRWVELRAHVMYDGEGNLVGNAGTMMDISLRRSTEAALHESERRRSDVMAAIVRTEDEERARLAIELHDDTIQVMTAALLDLDRLGRALREGRVAQAESIGESARRTLADAVERTRRLTFELRPPLLEANGLVAAAEELLGQLAGETGATTRIQADVRRLPAAVESLGYRSLQELVSNVRRHADASSVLVQIEEVGDCLRISVADDGRGFDVGPVLAAGARRRHIGLATTAERIRLAGGRFEVRSGPEGGTTVELSVPVRLTAS